MRTALVVEILVTIASFVAEFLTPKAFVVLGVIGLVVWVVKFFAAMVYLRWMAPRIPSAQIDARARQLMWLGPLVFIVGFVLCLLGPLIALVLYWFLLNRVRMALKHVRWVEMQGSL